MNLIKYNPFIPKRVSSVFDDFFTNGIGDFLGSDFSVNTPSINVVEKEDSYRIEVAAPGLEKKDFELSADNGFLTISAQREEREETKDEDGKFMRREFNYSTFRRSFQLPESVNPDDISAKYDNGVLLIHLPKKEEAKVQPVKVIKIK